MGNYIELQVNYVGSTQCYGKAGSTTVKYFQTSITEESLQHRYIFDMFKTVLAYYVQILDFWMFS